MTEASTAAGSADLEVETPRLTTIWDLAGALRADLLRLVVSWGVPAPDAEDLVQDAIVRAACGRPIDPTRVYAYLAVVVRRLVYDAHRATLRRERVRWALSGVRAGDASPEAVVMLRSQAEDIVRSALALAPRERDVFLLWAHGIPLGDVAAAMGVSYKSAESALGRARVRIRMRLLAADIKADS